MADLYLALLHHPVLDKNGQIVTTAVTNIDIHDIARSAATYGVRRFFVVTPVRALRALSEKILEHWETGYGSTYNATRKEALALVAIEPDLDGVLVAIERESGQRPVIVATSARAAPGSIDFADLRRRLERDAAPYLLVFGTGWGLAPQALERAELRLAPVCGPSPYNHLSVRAAAAIILDRLYRPG
jgi:hypothetical protein